MSTNHNDLGLQKLLMEALDFTELDLHANRAGNVSQNQLSRLFTRQKRLVRSTIAIIAFVVICFVVLAFIPINFVVQAIVAVLLFGLIFPTGLLLQDLWQIKRDLHGNKVHHTTGIVTRTVPTIRKYRGSGHIVYYDSPLGYSVSINGIYFWLPEEIWTIIYESDNSLTVHYLPHSKGVLSLELH